MQTGIIGLPSAGKTTICKELLKRNPKWMFSISVTTREKRGNEVRDKDYVFITNEKFDHLIKFGDLLEYEWVHGNRYGTLMAPLEDTIDNNKVMLLDIDVKGSMNILEEFPEDIISIFVEPPGFANEERIQILNERLKKRDN